ncbi:hypothetical protein WJX84_011778 [Apatococcus fuscideae]
MDEDILPPKKKKSPLVLAGAGVTAGVLIAGLMFFNKGNDRMSQHMMRARVIAQGVTVAIMVGTSGAWAVSSQSSSNTSGGPPDRSL